MKPRGLQGCKCERKRVRRAHRNDCKFVPLVALPISVNKMMYTQVETYRQMCKTSPEDSNLTKEN